ncbi:MAG: DUF2752 domain-containing protein [Victivallales bacterium]|nr:DUF2752 domain-containing protein [Victivallales bacterium]
MDHLNTQFRAKDSSGRETLVICICFACAVLLHFLRIDITHGILPKSISDLRFIGHHGFVCPLCGGTRAFAFLSVGSLPQALHCSLLGTCVAIWLLVTLPVRFIHWLFPICRWSLKSYLLIKKIEHPDLLIIAMAFFLCVQLWLHYHFGFVWIPLVDLLNS